MPIQNFEQVSLPILRTRGWYGKTDVGAAYQSIT